LQVNLRDGLEYVQRELVGTELLNETGADIRDVQEILGHASLSTTQLYTHKGAQRLAATAAKRFTRE